MVQCSVIGVTQGSLSMVFQPIALINSGVVLVVWVQNVDVDQKIAILEASRVDRHSIYIYDLEVATHKPHCEGRVAR